MQLIECPWCGPREEVEFHYGGQAHVAYPADPAALTDEQWAHYLFFRDNPKGLFAERWSHSAGCRRCFKATPGSGHVFAHTIAHDSPHPYNAPFTMERFTTGALIDEHGAAAVAH